MCLYGIEHIHKQHDYEKNKKYTFWELYTSTLSVIHLSTCLRSISEKLDYTDYMINSETILG